MAIVNILIAGVGGQGLVLTTDIIAQAAFLDGHEVATNDIIGLAQRGGKISGSVRFGDSVRTPNVPPASASVLLGLEKLETLRFIDQVIPGGIVLMNEKVIYPNPVIMEKSVYPSDVEDQIRQRDVRLYAIDCEEAAEKSGNRQAANTILIGALSTVVDISEESFIRAIQSRVPPKTIGANLAAFAFGRRALGAPARNVGANSAGPAHGSFEPHERESVKRGHPMDPAGYEIVKGAEHGDPDVSSPMDTEMHTWICTVCGFVYDPVAGDPDHGVVPGTLWQDVPANWICPLCSAGKDLFIRQ